MSLWGNKNKILLVFVLHFFLHYSMILEYKLLKIRDLQGLDRRTENPLVLLNPKFLITITPLYYRHLQECVFLNIVKIPFYIYVTIIPLKLNRVLLFLHDVTNHFLQILHFYTKYLYKVRAYWYGLVWFTRLF